MKTAIISTLLFAVSTFCSFATHLHGGEIRIEQVNMTSNSYKITVFVYTNVINTNVLFGGPDSWLDFGDGSRLSVPETPSSLRPDQGPDVFTAEFSVVHTYSGLGIYTVTYSEPNRDEGIVNMDESVNSRFFFESRFVVDARFRAPYSTPVSYMAPVFYAYVAENYSAALTCHDKNDLRLVYEIVTPQREIKTPVINYVLPENLRINQNSGQLTWDTKFNGAYIPGVYSVAVKVSQFDDENFLIGWMVRDFEIILFEENVSLALENSTNSILNNVIALSAGNSTRIKNISTAPGNHPLLMKMITEIDSTDGAFDFATYDSVSSSNRVQVGLLDIYSTESIARDNPYALIVRATTGKYNIDNVYLLYTKDPPDQQTVTSVNEGMKTQSIYPNPAAEFVHVSGERNSLMKYDIFDNAGNRNSGVVHSDEIDIRDLKPGVYILVLTTEKEISRLKFIKK